MLHSTTHGLYTPYSQLNMRYIDENRYKYTEPIIDILMIKISAVYVKDACRYLIIISSVLEGRNGTRTASPRI